jgi:hypothetical protein
MQSLNSSHLSVFDQWILNPKYPYHCILWIFTWKISSRLWGIKHIALHHMHIFVYIILYNVSCSLPHVIHTDSTQYKQFQNCILFWSCKYMSIYLGYFYVKYSCSFKIYVDSSVVFKSSLSLNHPLFFFFMLIMKKNTKLVKGLTVHVSN